MGRAPFGYELPLVESLVRPDDDLIPQWERFIGAVEERHLDGDLFIAVLNHHALLPVARQIGLTGPVPVKGLAIDKVRRDSRKRNQEQVSVGLPILFRHRESVGERNLDGILLAADVFLKHVLDRRADQTGRERVLDVPDHHSVAGRASAVLVHHVEIVGIDAGAPCHRNRHLKPDGRFEVSRPCCVCDDRRVIGVAGRRVIVRPLDRIGPFALAECVQNVDFKRLGQPGHGVVRLRHVRQEFRIARLDVNNGVVELAEEVLCGRGGPCGGIGVHREDQARFRIDRTAVCVHPEGVGHRRLVLILQDFQGRGPIRVFVCVALREPHVVCRVEAQRVVLERHLDGDVDIGGECIGELHVHGHKGKRVVGRGDHLLRGGTTHRHGDAGRQRVAHLDGAGDEVGDEVVRLIVDVRGRGGEEQLRGVAYVARSLHVERHARIAGVDAERAHLARDATAEVVVSELHDLSARRDLGHRVALGPHVQRHRRGRAALDRDRRHAGVRRGRSLGDRAPDVRRLVGIRLVEVDGLHIDARPPQVEVADLYVHPSHRLPL